MIECKSMGEAESIDDAEDLEQFLTSIDYHDLTVIDQAFTRFRLSAMLVFIGTPLRIIYWFGVQYPDGQCVKLINNFYMLSPFLKQIIFILYILRFAEALSMHLLIGNDLP